MLVAGYLLAQGLLFFSLVRLARNRARFLFWLSFLIPLNSVSFEWLSLWTWAKLAFVVGFIGWVLYGQRNLPRQVSPRHRGLRLFVLFLAYSVAVTFVWMIYDYVIGYRAFTAESMGWGFTQGVLRYPVQLFSFLTQWGLVFVGYWFTRSDDDLKAGIRGFVYGNLLNAVTGFYQMIALLLGLPWFHGSWILRLEQFNPDIRRSGWANLGFISLPRLSGLGGEPKHTGANLVIAIFLLLVMASHGQQSNVKIRHYSAIILLLSLALVFTFSVGSWVAFLICLGYIVLVSALSRKFRVLQSLFVLVLAGVILLGTVGFDSVQMVFDKYVGLKLSEPSVSKYTDSTILAILAEDPAQLIIGRGAGGSDFWLLDVVLTSGKPLSPAYTFTRFISEQGIIGLIMLLVITIRWSISLSRIHQPHYAHFVFGGLLLVMVSHVTGIYGYLLLCGSMIALVGRDSSASVDITHVVPSQVAIRKEMVRNENRL